VPQTTYVWARGSEINGKWRSSVTNGYSNCAGVERPLQILGIYRGMPLQRANCIRNSMARRSVHLKVPLTVLSPPGTLASFSVGIYTIYHPEIRCKRSTTEINDIHGKIDYLLMTCRDSNDAVTNEIQLI